MTISVEGLESRNLILTTSISIGSVCIHPSAFFIFHLFFIISGILFFRPVLISIFLSSFFFYLLLCTRAISTANILSTSLYRLSISIYSVGEEGGGDNRANHFITIDRCIRNTFFYLPNFFFSAHTAHTLCVFLDIFRVHNRQSKYFHKTFFFSLFFASSGCFCFLTRRMNIHPPGEYIFRVANNLPKIRKLGREILLFFWGFFFIG